MYLETFLVNIEIREFIDFQEVAADIITSNHIRIPPAKADSKSSINLGG